MPRLLRRLSPPLLLVVGVFATAALRSAAPHAAWSALAAPFLLVLTLVAADLLQVRLAGGQTRVSSAALVMGVAVLIAAAAIVSQDPAHFGAWIPILGSCGGVSLFLRREKEPQCSLD